MIKCIYNVIFIRTTGKINQIQLFLYLFLSLLLSIRMYLSLLIMFLTITKIESILRTSYKLHIILIATSFFSVS